VNRERPMDFVEIAVLPSRLEAETSCHSGERLELTPQALPRFLRMVPVPLDLRLVGDDDGVISAPNPLTGLREPLPRGMHPQITEGGFSGYTVNDEPQPQVPTALGLLNLKPAPLMPSW